MGPSTLARLELWLLPMRLPPATALGFALASLAGALGIGVIGRSVGSLPPCGPGFERAGVRCEIVGDACPSPFERNPRGCRPPDRTVLIPSATIAVGPSDWEAEGLAQPRTLRVLSFRIDAFEVPRGVWEPGSDDPLVAASGMTREAASRYCRGRAGRLPTEDEWTVAALSAAAPPRRYPWGDTGAVCRRAAWGLEHGPCATGATGPDTVGAHGEGDTPLGVHDLAGNVAEWVESDPTRPATAVAKGGSWRTTLASDMRVWARLELDPEARRRDVGLRCAYPP